MSKVIKAALVSLVAVGAMSASVSPAFAEEPYGPYSVFYGSGYTLANPNGTTYFYMSSQKIYVRDLAADGHSIVARYWTGDPASPAYKYTAWNHSGAGTAIVGADLNYAKGTVLHLQACIGEYGTKTVLHCNTGDAGRVVIR